ncbi:acetyltransferase [Pseudovibrio japonicus]|nr:acetyltransferase [Pseudovibrio japonicus]
MFQIRPSNEQDTAQILEIWRRAVDATHHFLEPHDLKAIEQEVAAFFPQVRFVLAVDDQDKPLGFMFLHEGHLEALFVDPSHHGKGIGKQLIKAALAEHPNLTTDVNEQNTQAVGFYRSIGFQETGRSELDAQGRPYPLIHMRFANNRCTTA